MKTILLTGAAGIVGRALRPELTKHHAQIILTDLKEIHDLVENESFEQGDLADFEFVRSVTSKVDGVVHLGGRVGPDVTFDEALRPNIIGVHNIHEAARVCGVSRIVYAGSAHTMGFIKRGKKIDHLTLPRPNGQYALSKTYGEFTGSYYVDNYNLNVFAIRIGYLGNDLSKEHRLRTWVSARDLVQLIEIGLSKDLGFQITYGVSDNPEPFFDNSNAFHLGYQPKDCSTDFIKDPSLLEAVPDLNSIEGGVVGGRFSATGFEGDSIKILK